MASVASEANEVIEVALNELLDTLAFMASVTSEAADLKYVEATCKVSTS